MRLHKWKQIIQGRYIVKACCALGAVFCGLLMLTQGGCSSLDWTGSPPQGRYKPREAGTPQSMDDWGKLPRARPLGN